MGSNFSFPDILTSIRVFFLDVCALIYSAVGECYKLFISLANAKLFTNDVMSTFTDRVYYIVSVVMLFVLAYSLLTNIINPDGMVKDKNGIGNVIKKVIISLALLVFVPSLFQFGFSIQSSILEDNIIGKLVLGSSNSNNVTYNMSSELVATLFESTFYELGDVGDDVHAQYMIADAEIRSEEPSFEQFQILVETNPDGVKFNYVASIAVGIFALYVLIVYAFDVGLRAVKLAFLQLIAPIPILLYIVPNQSKTLGNWAKETVKSFLEVFVKITVLMFCVFAINTVCRAFSDGSIAGMVTTGSVGMFSKLFIILGILMFVKVAPKLISDIFGVGAGSGLSLGERWKNIKEGFSTISAPAFAPAKKVISTVGGYHYAMKAYRQGVASGNKDTKSRKARAAFHGMRKGFSGGISKMGEAYKYEMDNQYAYANKSDMSRNEYDIRRRDIENDQSLSLSQRRQKLSELRYQYLSSKDSFSAFTNSIRDNVGMVSLYEEAKFQAQVDRDNDNAPRRHQIALMDEAIFAADKDIVRAESRHSTKKDVASSAKAIIDYAKTEVSKEKSLITTDEKYKLKDNKGNVLLSGNTNAFAFEKLIYDIENNQTYTAKEKADLILKAKDQIKALTNSYISQQLAARTDNNTALMDSGFNRCVGDYLYAVDSAGTHLYNKVVDTDLHEESVFTNLSGKVATDYAENPIQDFKTDALSSVEKLRLVSDILNQADDITKTSISNARATRTVTYFDKARDRMVTSNIAEAKAIEKELRDAMSEKDKETEKYLESHNSDHK